MFTYIRIGSTMLRNENGAQRRREDEGTMISGRREKKRMNEQGERQAYTRREKTLGDATPRERERKGQREYSDREAESERKKQR